MKQHLRYVGPESRGHFSDLIQVRKPGNAGNGKGKHMMLEGGCGCSNCAIINQCCISLEMH